MHITKEIVIGHRDNTSREPVRFTKIALSYLAIITILAVTILSLAGNVFAVGSIRALNQGNRNHTLGDYSIPESTVILTFDDGPSPHTHEILDILAREKVSATFFVIGKNAIRHDGLKRIINSGHEIGNHTFSHANINLLPDWIIDIELNVTRFIIEAQTEHSTRLFRPPFLELDENQQANKLIHIAKTGYIIAYQDIDSLDWQNPGPEQIFKNSTKSYSTGKPGIVVLFHDGGGDRHQTAKALPAVISYYRERGYRFTTFSEALQIPRNELMPPVEPRTQPLANHANILVSWWLGMAHFGNSITIILVGMMLIRVLFVPIAAVIQSRKKRKFPPKYPPCTVIVPAYNEADVIKTSIRSLLASNHPNFFVIVVDDGSKDNTFQVASTIKDSRLRVVRKKNGGKSTALNYGISLARTNIVVTVDADTIFPPDTLKYLCRHFFDQTVGAVSGNAKIANRHNLITKFQSLEYIIGFNIDRRMGDLLDCITVVPGVVGAFRVSAINKVGGFSTNTLAEDTDLTFAIKKAGYKIVYDQAAIAYTEAPQNYRDWLKQRYRWTFGTMQAVWKHRTSFLNPAHNNFGMIGLPYLVVYQIIFPLLNPVFDLVLVIGLITGRINLMVIALAAYTVLDFIYAGIALKLDREKLFNLWLIIPQRIIYRPFQYYIIVKSFLNVLKGQWVGWNKLKREGKLLAKMQKSGFSKT